MARLLMRRRVGAAYALGACAMLLAASEARAGGYDTPVVYSARHVGMGGTSIGYVDDASAIVLNPAGLRGVKSFALLGDVSLLLARVQGSPDLGKDATSVESEPALGPFALIAAGYRVHPWLTLGLGAYPVASGGATYDYTNVAGIRTVDETRIVFLELSPALSLNLPDDALLPGALAFGVGYRVDALLFERHKGPPGNPVVIDLALSGMSATGLRLGAQWRLNSHWSFGLTYRTRVDVSAEGDAGTALSQVIEDPHATFVLPAKLGVGARLDVDRIGVAVDLEHGFYSGNGQAPLRGSIGGVSGSVSNVFAWRDAQTLRTGLEYRLGETQQVPVRAGYVFDGTVSNPRYPSAFGTPPGPTHSLTVGIGYRFTSVQLNAAYAYRFGTAQVDAANLAPSTACRFCSQAGEYALRMHGFYVDASFSLPE